MSMLSHTQAWLQLRIKSHEQKTAVHERSWWLKSQESCCTYPSTTLPVTNLSRGKSTVSNYSTTCEASFRVRLGITTGVALTSHLKESDAIMVQSCAVQQLFRHVYSDNHGNNNTPKEHYDVWDQKLLVWYPLFKVLNVLVTLCTQRLCISASNSSVQCEVATN